MRCRNDLQRTLRCRICDAKNRVADFLQRKSTQRCRNLQRKGRCSMEGYANNMMENCNATCVADYFCNQDTCVAEKANFVEDTICNGRAQTVKRCRYICNARAQTVMRCSYFLQRKLRCKKYLQRTLLRCRNIYYFFLKIAPAFRLLPNTN